MSNKDEESFLVARVDMETLSLFFPFVCNTISQFVELLLYS